MRRLKSFVLAALLWFGTVSYAFAAPAPTSTSAPAPTSSINIKPQTTNSAGSAVATPKPSIAPKAARRAITIAPKGASTRTN